MRGQGCFKNIAMRRVLVAVLTALLPLAALMSFTGEAFAADPVKIQLEHWGNGGTPQSVAKWRNGNLHWTNSHYQEGDADPTRMIMDNLTPGQAYSLTFTFMAAKKQAKVIKHGHDFLTNYTFSEFPTYTPTAGVAPSNPNAGYPDPCKPRVQGGSKEPNVCELNSAPTDVYPIQEDTFGNGQLKVSDRQKSVTFPQYFSMWNGDITSVSDYTYSPTTVFKDTTYVTLTVNFTAGAQGEGEGVVLAFGGHLAKSTSAPTGWGAGQGAADINGAPYHWAYNLLDSNGNKIAQGARNRSIMIRRDGHIQIVKSCVNVDPNDDEYPSNFPFTATNPSSVQQDGIPYSFYLDCDPENGTVEQSTVITGGSGQYSVSESPLPGYFVTSIVCSILDKDGTVSGTKNLTITPSLPVGYPNTVTASFDFNASETIRCVFTNTKPAASIELTPNEATNLIWDPHTVTAHVFQDDGTGPKNAPNGTVVQFSLLPPGTAAFFVGGISSCTITNGLGTCTIQINSGENLTVDTHATTTFKVNGVDVTASTGTHVTGDNRTDARKFYVDPDPSPLTIIKCVVNDQGRTASPTDFLFSFNGTALPWGTFPRPITTPACPQGYTGVADGFVYPVEVERGPNGFIPVPYEVTEAPVDGYLLVFASADCKGTFTAGGQAKTCIMVNDDQIDGRMTGGGSVFFNRGETAVVNNKKERVRITHGFELHCNRALPNRLEVVWHDGADAFHLENLTYARCEDNPNYDPENPDAEFDTFFGRGTGRINNNTGNLYTIEFKLTDKGERGSDDTADFVIKLNGTTVLSSVGEKVLEFGNHQAHENNK